MIKDIQELNFPSYATLSSATVTLNDMGDRTISAQVKIDGSIVPDFSFDWEVEFKGERYIQPLRQPQASKGNESMRSTIDLVFYHKTIWQLKRYYFVEMTSTESGTAIADQYIASLGLNLSDFCVAFQKVLDYYFDSEISIDLNPNLDYTKGVQFMSISYSYIWDVLQKMYEVYGVRWHIEGNTIKVGYPSPILSHTFQYGYEGGLLQVERQVQDANIRNSLLGRGGEQNLPAYYFKEAPEGSLFASDPDAIPELANIYFSNLRGKTFRDYVKGWKAKHYGGEPMSEPTEAYTKGYTDTKFSPIEYVEDKDSIKKYGLLQGALDNNEDIYPSIQGAPNGEDVVVYVEPVTSDDVEQSVGKAETIVLNGMSQFRTITREQNGSKMQVALQSEVFEVPKDSYALTIGNNVTYNIYRGFNFTPIWEGNALVDVTEVVINKDTNEVVDKESLSKGKYQVVTTFDITLPIYDEWPTIGSADNISFVAQLGISTSLQLRKLQDGTTDKWLPTFNIWVKNIWGTTRKAGESDLEYAERVWRPILGDRQGNEAKVCFSSGWLSGHEDYEFTIVDFAYDNSHEHNGSKSEWRLTLAKSDAELDATGKYIPSASTNGQAYAGDTFFFIGIDMPHQYVLWAEERLDNYKTSSLNEVSEIQPKWVVRFDKLRLHEGEDNLAEQIVVGGAINLADVRFIDAPALQLYLQSVTYTWSEQTLLYPDIEVVLADTIVPVQNPVAQLQGNIDAINSQLHSIGNIAQVVRKIGDSLYLRKDGVADISKSPTKFVGNVSGNNFRQGKVGGSDWGIYRDENGNTIAEFDKIVARKDLEVNNYVINQVSYVGGMQITSAASLEITRVIEDDNSYQCFFDQKGGSVANLFQVNDIAYSQRFDEDNNTTKYYKRVVVAVDIDSITLSKSQADGEGVPMANDVVIHYGNTTDTNRQYIIIRDVIGGGYERMLSDLNSVSATGVEYYFAGRMDGDTPRWFVGNNEQFIEYKDGHLQINADVTLGSGSDLSASEEFQDVKQTANQAKQDAQNAEASAKSYADELVKDLQNQLDGKVESFFYGYDPTLSNLPASEWTTDELKEEHLNDTFTNTESGQSWRWLFKDGSYQWVEIADTQSSEALAKAQEALGVANGKVAVFVTEPRTPYNAKDLWLQGEDGRIKRCTTTRTTTGEFYAEDWVNADDSHEYTDDKIAKYKQSVDATIANLDKAIEDAEKTSKDYTDEGKKALQASIDALNKAKANVDDVYDKATADGLINQAEYDAISAAQELANAAQELAVETSKAYADGEVDKEEAARIKQAQDNLNTAKKYAEEKAKEAEDNAKDEIDTFDYLKQAMAQNTTLSGGLVQTTLLQLGYRVGDNLIVQSGTNGIYNSDLKGGGIASWWGGDMLDKEVEGVTGRVAQALLRMDGTGYLAGGNITWDLYGAGSVAGGNLSWDKDGNITLSDNIRISSDKDETLGTVLTSISKLQSSLTSFKSLFDSMFEKDSDGNIHAKLSLWSSGGITAGGVGSGGSGGGGISYNRLDAWSDYSADKAGYVLSALLGKDLDNRVSALANAGYVTQSALAPYALRSEIPSLEGYFLASNFNQANLKSTLGISDWALAATKPSYTATEVGALSVNGGNIGGSLNFRNGSSITCANGIVLEMYAGVDTYLRGSSNIYISAPNVYTQRNVYTYKVLDSGNYTDYALSKNGGTISDLIIDRNPSVIQYKKNGASVGYLGIASELKPVLYNAEGNTAYMILHSGNYSNLLAGGTINGGMTFASGNLIVSNGHTVVGELYPKNDGSIDLGQWSRKWKDVYLGGYLTWGNSVDSTNLGDWEALKDNIGLRIISSKTSDSGAPYQYATALHVRGRYGFELAVQGGDIDSFAIRSVTNNRGWNRLLHSGNYSSYALSTNGGTVNGETVLHHSNSLILTIKRTGSGASLIRYNGDEGLRGGIGFGTDGVARIWDNTLSGNYPILTSNNFSQYALPITGGTVNGSITANSLTIGGVTLTYDSVNEALCINGNMYALGGITAGGAGISAYTSLESRVARLEQQLNIS